DRAVIGDTHDESTPAGQDCASGHRRARRIFWLRHGRSRSGGIFQRTSAADYRPALRPALPLGKCRLFDYLRDPAGRKMHETRSKAIGNRSRVFYIDRLVVARSSANLRVCFDEWEGRVVSLKGDIENLAP